MKIRELVYWAVMVALFFVFSWCRSLKPSNEESGTRPLGCYSGWTQEEWRERIRRIENHKTHPPARP